MVAPKSDSVDYAAALRHYSRYGRGRSMRKFCEDEGYDYWKFCRYVRSGQAEMNIKTGGGAPGFVEVKPDGTAALVSDEPVRVNRVRFRFSNGMVSLRLTSCMEQTVGHLFFYFFRTGVAHHWNLASYNNTF